jgi:cellulose synthase/poly-beta-1,6-N-acetylglucosamine synthase-like glycosyltransferase
MIVVFCISAGVVIYAVAGYPLLLWLIVRLRGERHVRKGPELPLVTFIISAFNEAGVIRQKLENTLSLDYPSSRLEVVVISDASTDATDAIVREYGARGVRLARQPQRRGKTAGLNAVVPESAGDVVVFSDANAMYAKDALRKLVRNFSDPDVGCVTGEARYVETATTTADAGERAYWHYEIQLKRMETAVGSMVGGDGAIYAIRKPLWRQLPDNAINDFLNPLQIASEGWRTIYEPEAVCFEETAGHMSIEYHRRIRIVSRSWRAVFQARSVLNPFRVGFFTVSVISHKVLRWLAGPLSLAAVVSLAIILIRSTVVTRLTLGAAAAGIAIIAVSFSPLRHLAQLGVYFAVLAMASVVGVLKGTIGRVSGTWTSTPRSLSTPHSETGPTFAPWRAVIMVICGVIAATAVLAWMGGIGIAIEALFWFSISVLGYVYFAYPLIIWMISLRPSRTVQPPASFEPTVCVFITANDEAQVIAAKLRNTLALDYPADKLDVVVASDGSIDGTNEIVQGFAGQGIRLLAFPERRGKIAAINDGIASVTAEIVVFSDANTILERNAVRGLVKNFADAAIGAVSGDVMLEGDRAALGTSEDLYYRYERWLQACESRIGTMVGVDGALYAVRRSLFVSPPSDTILDDMAIPMAVARAGRRVVFEPQARGHERGAETAMEEFARKARVVAGAVQFLKRPESAVPRRNRQLLVAMLSHKALRWLSPVFALIALVSAIALAPASDLFMFIASGQVLFMLTGLAGCWPRLRRMGTISLAHYFWLVQAAAAVGFVRGLFGHQSVAWRRFNRAPVELA